MPQIEALEVIRKRVAVTDRAILLAWLPDKICAEEIPLSTAGEKGSRQPIQLDDSASKSQRRVVQVVLFVSSQQAIASALQTKSQVFCSLQIAVALGNSSQGEQEEPQLAGSALLLHTSDPGAPQG